MGGVQTQRDSQMDHHSMQRVDLFNDQMHKAMAQANATASDEGKHVRGPTNASASTVHGGAGGQLFDTPNQSYNLNHERHQNEYQQPR